MKKRSTLIVIACVIVMVASFSIAACIIQKNILFSGSRADYKSNKEHFEIVVDWLAEKYGGQDVDLRFTVYDYGNRLCKLGSDEVPAEVSEAFVRVDRAFRDDAYLEYIRIRGSQISFCTWGYKYALVYSPAKPPQWVYNEDDSIFTEKLGDGWYHVTKK